MVFVSHQRHSTVPRAPAIMNYHSLGSEWADVPAPPILAKSVVPGTADWKPDVGLPAL